MRFTKTNQTKRLDKKKPFHNDNRVAMPANRLTDDQDSAHRSAAALHSYLPRKVVKSARRLVSGLSARGQAGTCRLLVSLCARCAMRGAVRARNVRRTSTSSKGWHRALEGDQPLEGEEQPYAEPKPCAGVRPAFPIQPPFFHVWA